MSKEKQEEPIEKSYKDDKDFMELIKVRGYKEHRVFDINQLYDVFRGGILTALCEKNDI
jgi:hypothetical protein